MNNEPTFEPRIGIAVHGGAGALRGKSYGVELDHLRGCIEEGRDRLLCGTSALDVATETAAVLEASGLYIAGRGASANTRGERELDAGLMDGARGRAGAVAALQGFANPIYVARAVMERTPHVLLVGAGAADFARTQRMEEIVDPNTWFTPACTDEANVYLPLGHGTIGCVACDQQGRLASATSTGGVFGKMPGRVGDTAIVGAGVWADRVVAVSCTGQGEYFIRATAATQVSCRMRWAGQSLDQSAQSALQEVVGLGGQGGLIAIDARGNVSMPYHATGMKRAALLVDGSIVAAVF